jgi:hypothetical protein
MCVRRCDNPLSHQLRRAHDATGVDGLIRGGEEQATDAMRLRSVDDIHQALNVRRHSIARRPFAEHDMLECRCVENHIDTPAVAQYRITVAQVAEKEIDVGVVRMVVAEEEQLGFVIVYAGEMGTPLVRELAEQFSSNRAADTRNQNVETAPGLLQTNWQS